MANVCCRCGGLALNQWTLEGPYMCGQCAQKSIEDTPAQADSLDVSVGLTIYRDPELRRAALAVITANARWLGSGAEDVEYEGLQKAIDALKEALAK